MEDQSSEKRIGPTTNEDRLIQEEKTVMGNQHRIVWTYNDILSMHATSEMSKKE